MGKKKFSDEEVLELWSQNLTDGEIAKLLGVERPSITIRRNKLGLKPNFIRRKYTDAEFLYWYNKKLNDFEIAEKLNVSRGSIEYKRQKLGLKPNFKCDKKWRKKISESKKTFEDKKLIALHEKGLVDKEIAKELNIPYSTVSRRRKSLGLEVNRKSFTDEEFLYWYNQKMNDTEIARMLEASHVIVSYRRNKLGLPPNYDPQSEEWREKMSKSKKTFEDKKLLDLYNQNLNDLEISEKLNIPRTTITSRRRKLGLKSKYTHQDGGWRKKQSVAHNTPKMKARHREVRKKIKIPKNHTKPELQFIELIQKSNLPFIYVGDNKIQIPQNGQDHWKNPDFIHSNGTKLVIEIFGSDYYHNPLKKQGLPYHKTYQGTIEHYKKHGYKCCILWRQDLKDEDHALKKLEKFGIIPNKE